MAKILTFRNKDGDDRTPQFLQDGNDTLPFRTTAEGHTDLGDVQIPALSTRPKVNVRDWSNQELADLFRVKRLLDAAGVSSEIDRGLTDEGDPWFVFVGSDGEVFIHLCRLDGVYVLDSPNISKPLRGVSFEALIADFTNRSVPASPAPGPNAGFEHRVVRLERGGKIRLHPSALLAALVWTLLLSSQDLVLMTPANSDAEGAVDDLIKFGDGDGTAAHDDGIMAHDVIDTAALAKEDAHGHHDPRDAIHAAEADLHMRENQGMALHQNGFALGLSTLAIAMGFMSETILVDERQKILDGLRSLGLSPLQDGETAQQADAADMTADDADGNPIVALLDEISQFLDDVTRKTTTETAAASETDTTDTADVLDQTLAFSDSLNADETTADTAMSDASAHGSDEATIDTALLDPDTAPAASPEGLDLSLLEEVPEDTSAQDGDALPTLIYTAQSIYDLVQALQPALQEFTLGDTTVQATFDLTDETYSDTGIIDLVTPTLAAADPANAPVAHDDPALPSYNAMVKSFVDFVMASSGHLDMIASQEGIILIDKAGIDASGDSAYAMTWEYDDGGFISIVGAASDFHDFGLIT